MINKYQYYRQQTSSYIRSEAFMVNNYTKFSWAISIVNIGLKTNVSEISVSIIWVHVVNDKYH
jgi:hypothetical protein